MKTTIANIVQRDFDCTTAYSGSLNTLFIKGDRKEEAYEYITKLYPNLSFKVTAKDIEEDKEVEKS